ncbi:MAG: zinc ribbon domain-containing protein, partial [Acutalibacteraceae bacterium]|nr:zinc ribbon domain-containing protein [Acutalibacteraceae bacterium]
MFCGNCGTNIEDNAVFCPNCGAAQANSSNNEVQNNTQQNNFENNPVMPNLTTTPAPMPFGDQQTPVTTPESMPFG